MEYIHFSITLYRFLAQLNLMLTNCLHIEDDCKVGRSSDFGDVP